MKLLISKKIVKILGRTYTDENGILWLSQSADAIEFKFKGSFLNFNLLGDITSNTENYINDRARFAIYVDNKIIKKEMMDSPTKSITLNFADEKYHKILFIKLSEAKHSSIGIENLETDENSQLIPTKENQVKIEFIGDSITCGYGVDSKSSDEIFSTMTEDVSKSFAYLAAKKIKADYSFVSYSSFGLYAQWTPDGSFLQNWLIPNFYEDVSYCIYESKTNYKRWNFDNFKPTYILINLGTNDESYLKDYTDRQEKFSDAYIAFLIHLRSANPNAKIICSLSIMKQGKRQFPWVERAYEIYKKLTNDKKIFLLEFGTQKDSEGYACGEHPSKITHKRCAQELVDFINSIKDL